MMQDQNQRKSKRGMPKLLVLFITVYAFLFLIVPLRINNSRGPSPEKLQETVEVAMMKKSIPAGMVITLEHINKEIINRDELPKEKIISPIQTIGRILSIPVVEGQVLTESCFASQRIGPLPNWHVPDGMQAFVVPVFSKVMPDRALLYPGCIVDVQVAYRLSGRESEGQALSVTMLRGIQVLAVSGDSVISNPEGGTKKSNSTRGRLVTLLVSPRQAEALELAVQKGSISLTLRNPLDKKKFEWQPLHDQRPSIKRNDIWNKIDFWQLIPEDHPRRLWLLSSDSFAED